MVTWTEKETSLKSTKTSVFFSGNREWTLSKKILLFSSFGKRDISVSPFYPLVRSKHTIPKKLLLSFRKVFWKSKRCFFPSFSFFPFWSENLPVCGESVIQESILPNFSLVFYVPRLATCIFLSFLQWTRNGCRNCFCHGFDPIPSSILDETRFEPTTFRSWVKFANR